MGYARCHLAQGGQPVGPQKLPVVKPLELFLRLVEPLDHPVEGVGQAAELVLRPDLHLDVEVTRLHVPHGADQVVDGTGDEASHHEAQERGRQDDGQAGEGEHQVPVVPDAYLGIFHGKAHVQHPDDLDRLIVAAVAPRRVLDGLHHAEGAVSRVGALERGGLLPRPVDGVVELLRQLPYLFQPGGIEYLSLLVENPQLLDPRQDADGVENGRK